MATEYERTGADSGIVGLHAKWLLTPTEHPRLLRVPIVPTIDEQVLLLTDLDGRTPRLPELSFTSPTFPDVGMERRDLFPNGQYIRLQHLVIDSLSRNLISTRLRRTPGIVNLRFMECYKAYSSDLNPDRRKFIGASALTVPQTMVEVKQLPFHADLNISPEDIRINPAYQRRQRLTPGPRPYTLRPISEVGDKLQGLVTTLSAARQTPQNLIDILQLFEVLKNMTPERTLDAAHS